MCVLILVLIGVRFGLWLGAALASAAVTRLLVVVALVLNLWGVTMFGA